MALTNILTDIANAIRDKNGETKTYKPAEMAEAIEAISGGTVAEIKVTYAEGAVCTCSNGTITLTASDTSGTYIFEIPEEGDWTITATNETYTATEVVTVPQSVNLLGADIFDRFNTSFHDSRTTQYSIIDKKIYMSMSDYNSSWTSLNSVRSDDMIDVTKYKKILIGLNNIEINDSAVIGICLTTSAFGGSTTSDSGLRTLYPNALAYINESASKINLIADISEYEGDYYIYIFVGDGVTKLPGSYSNSVNGAGSVYINSIRLFES